MNDLNEIDAAQQNAIDHYLVEYGYPTLEAWADDSDYIYDDEADEWYDGNVVYDDGFVRDVGELPPPGVHRLSDPLGSMVDLRVQLLAALGEI